MENSNSKNKSFFLFGKRLFIGFIKFYDSDKKFGFIASNNYGMDNNPKYRSTSQAFYFDEHSILSKLSLNSLVVFQLLKRNGRVKAVNVRKFDLEKDRNLAMTYFYNKNFIYYTEKETIFHRYKSNEVSYNNITISILLKSGICRYEIIQQLNDSYKKEGQEKFLCGIDKLVFAAGGDKKYCQTLISNYKNRDKENECIVKLINDLDEETIKKLVISHPCFQKYAPKNLLLSIIEKLDTKFYIPDEFIPLLKEIELKSIINDGSVFDLYYTLHDINKIRNNGKQVKGNVEKILECCPDAHKKSLELAINENMINSVKYFVDNLEQKTKMEKIDFLLIYKKFIDLEQEQKINHSIDKDIISEVRAECIDLKNKDASYYILSSFIDKQSKAYYSSSPFVQSKTIDYIKGTYFCLYEQVLNFIAINDYTYGSCELFKQLKRDVINSELVKNEFSNVTDLLLKNRFIDLYKEGVLTGKISKYFLNDFGTVVSQKEYERFIKNFSKQLIDEESIGTIYYFYHNVLEINPPMSLETLMRSKNIDQIIDFGLAFDIQEDKGYSIRDLAFSLIKDNSDANGNFILDNQPDGKRAKFVGYFFIHRDWDRKWDYINSLSFHDRILLSQSKYYGFDIASVQDLKLEFKSINPNNKINHITQRIRNSKTAIIEIINELTCSEQINSLDLIAWLRQYLDIHDRTYRDKEKQVRDEDMLIDSIKRAEFVLGIRMNQFGIDSNNRHIATSYDSLSYCDSLISQIFKWNIENENGLALSLLKEEYDKLPSTILSFIEEILCDKFTSKSIYRNYDNIEMYEIQCHSNIDFQPQNILSFVLLNVFNNISYIIDKENSRNSENVCSKPLIINNISALCLTTCVLNMNVKHGMDAFWRVGDRGDIVTDYTDIELDFYKTPSPHILEIITKQVPELANESTTKYSYHFSETDIASGYGRCYDWDDSDKYKARIIIPILKEIYLAFKKGLPMFSE